MGTPAEGPYLGIWGCVSLFLANIIGSGIFNSPTAILQDTSSLGLALCVWLVMGFVSTTGALTYGELASTLQRGGGDTTVAQLINWRKYAFILAVLNILVIYPTVVCVQSLTFSQYFISAIGMDVEDPTTSRFCNAAIAAGFVLFLFVLNIVLTGPQLSMFNIAALVIKMVLLVAVLVIGGVKGEVKNIDNMFGNSTLNPDLIMGSFYNAWFAFLGYDILAVGVEEVVDPTRNLPLAIYISMPLVTLMYLLINVAYGLVLGTDAMTNAESVVTSFAAVALGDQEYILPIIVCICLVGTLNASLFEGSRIYYAAGRAGIVPNCLAAWSPRFRTPRSALFVYVAISLILLFALTSDQLNYLNTVEFIAQCVQSSVTTLCLLYVRLSRIQIPERVSRPNILFMTFYLVCLVALGLGTAAADWTQIWLTIIVFVGSLLFYLVFRWPRTLNAVPAWGRANEWLSDKSVAVAQFLFRCECQIAEPASAPASPKKRKVP